MFAVHVVVVGCGRVGSELAVGLDRRGHSVVVVDKNQRAFRRLPEGWGGRTIVGLGFDRGVLSEAEIEQASALAAVTSGDNSNILTARIARETYQISNVVARIYDPRRAVIYQRLGIPTVATVTWTTDQVMRRLFPEESAIEWSDPTGELVLVERSMPEIWAGHRIDEIDLGPHATLVAVTRAGSARLDVKGLVGQEGDLLYVAVVKDALTDLDRQMSSPASV
jgi:trk/ktr system potassium uptake protein